jgi:hypothetical protein
MSDLDSLYEQVLVCPAGSPGWRQFEDACTNLLQCLWVPPFRKPYVQARTFSGIDRRDAIFPNRDMDVGRSAGYLRHELDAKLILVEFKNYDHSDISKEEVDQTRNYLTDVMGKLAIMCCNKKPLQEAHTRRNWIYAQQEKKVILFLTPDELQEMCFIKERGEDPVDLLVDLLDLFYIQWG